MSQRFNHGAHFAEVIVPLLTADKKCVVFDEVEVPPKLKEALPGDARSHWKAVQNLAGRPLVIEVRQLHDTHHDDEANEHFHLISTGRPGSCSPSF